MVTNPLKAPEKTIANIPTLIDRTVFPGVQGGPHMHAVAAKAVCFHEAATDDFRRYAAQVLANAKELANQLMLRGMKLVTNGTDNHLLLIDVMTSLGIDGHEAEHVLDSVGLTLNLAAAKFVRQGYTAVIRCERCQGLMELTAGEVVIQDREGPRRSGVGANKGADSPRWGAFNADMRRDGAPSTSRGGV
jgi:hypothetical protein